MDSFSAAHNRRLLHRCFIAWRLHVYRERVLLDKLQSLLRVPGTDGPAGPRTPRPSRAESALPRRSISTSAVPAPPSSGRGDSRPGSADLAGEVGDATAGLGAAAGDDAGAGHAVVAGAVEGAFAAVRPSADESLAEGAVAAGTITASAVAHADRDPLGALLSAPTSQDDVPVSDSERMSTGSVMLASPTRPAAARVVCDYKAGTVLDAAVWAACCDAAGVVRDVARVFECVLGCGCSPDMRQTVWPFLLGVYRFDSTAAERAACVAALRASYAAALARCTAGGADPYEGTDLAFARQMDNIEYDIARGESEYEYFVAHPESAAACRNILAVFVSQNRSVGYVQGMSDILEPLMVVIDDEALTHACFARLMSLYALRFERTNEVDIQVSLSQLRAVLTAMDPALMEFLQSKELDHLYFVYRWFLVDFKRDVAFKDIFLLWETIWVGRTVLSAGFAVFVAFSALQMFRRDIMALNNDTDVFSFFSTLPPLEPASLLLMAKTTVPALASCVMQMSRARPTASDPALRHQAEQYFDYDQLC